MQITYCPPTAAASILPPEKPFSGRNRESKAVHMPEYRDGEYANGVSFADYSRMHTRKRGGPITRKNAIPEYAGRPDLLRRVLVRFIEARAFSKKQIAAVLKKSAQSSDATRLRRAMEKLLSKRPGLITVLDRLCEEYCTEGVTAARRKVLAREIETLDAQLRVTENLPSIVVGVVYRSYCLAEDSVAVGLHLHLSPVAVRQLLSRMNRVWKQMESEEAKPTPCGRLRKSSIKRLVSSRRSTAKWFANLTPEQREARNYSIAVREGRVTAY